MSAMFLRKCRAVWQLSHNSTIAPHICSRCGMLYIAIGETGRCLRARFGKHRRAVTSNDTNQPVARHFGSHCVSDMKI